MSFSETSQPSDITGGRKLVAVLYADMVGYSRLIGSDDVGTLQRLKALRANLIDRAIQEHGGLIIQTGGDSLLVTFDSVDGAVRCAVKVQEQIRLRSRGQCWTPKGVRWSRRNTVTRAMLGIEVAEQFRVCLLWLSAN